MGMLGWGGLTYDLCEEEESVLADTVSSPDPTRLGLKSPAKFCQGGPGHAFRCRVSSCGDAHGRAGTTTANNTY